MRELQPPSPPIHTCLAKKREKNSHFVYSVLNIKKSFRYTGEYFEYIYEKMHLAHCPRCKYSMCCVLFFVETWNQQDGITRLNNSTCHITNTSKTLTLKENGKDKKFRNKKTVEKLQILNPNTKSIPFRNGPL